MTTRTKTAVLVPCRINVGAAWDDACIHEVAHRSIVVSTRTPLRVGDYLQARRGTLVIVGRVLWLRDGRAGIRTQDPVSAADLVDEPRLTRRPATANVADRRGAARATAALSPAAQAERSRRVSSLLQFAVLTLAAGGGAYLLASQLYVVLTMPFARISAVLGG